MERSVRVVHCGVRRREEIGVSEGSVASSRISSQESLAEVLTHLPPSLPPQGAHPA